MVIAPPLPLSDRPEFGPPPNARSWRALALAVAAHLLLVVALTWGVNWKNSDEAAAFSAELWTGQPPPPQSPTSPEQPAPQPVPRPAPAPPPQPAQPPPTPAPAPPPDVDIAIEQAKKRALLRKQQAAEDREEQKAADLAAKKQAKLQEEKVRLKAEQAADKAQAIKLKTQEAAKEAAKETVREAAREAARDAKDAKDAKNAKDAQRKQELQKQAATAAAAAAAAKGQRDANLARLNAQLGSTTATGGSPKGTAVQGSGGSTTYGAIVKAAIKPNVVFGDDITGNPMAKVEVRLTLDGTIISQRLIASSGNKAWDDAAMNGITRTRVMPRDVDGRIPDTTLILEMRPKN